MRTTLQQTVTKQKINSLSRREETLSLKLNEIRDQIQ